MATVDAAPEALDALMAGKRVSPRLPVSMKVRLKGALQEFTAQAKDLSSEGSFVTLDLKSLVKQFGKDILEPSGQFAFIDRHFRQSFDVCFVGTPVAVEAKLVRLALDAGEDALVGLGCRFVHPLTAKQEGALGLRTRADSGSSEGDWAVSSGIHDVCRPALIARPVTALLADGSESEEVAGPLFLGPVTLIGRSALVVRLDGADPVAAGERLMGKPLFARLLLGSDELEESTVECVAVRYVDAPRPGAEVLLAMPRRMKRKTLRHFASA